MTTFTRLSALDRSFLDIEDRTTHMHVGATCIFEAGPLAGPEGGIDIDAIRRFVGSRLHLIPRYRQRLAHVPVEGHPVWVDDEHFELAYHVRHTALPWPGGERELKRLSGRIYSQQLDRGKPLWEMWVVEGLSGGRFAIVNKAHHCMIDGLAGADLLAALLTIEAEPPREDGPAWYPTPSPTTGELLRHALRHRFVNPVTAVARTAGEAILHPIKTANEIVDVGAGIGETLAGMSKTASSTPLNDAIGAHRRFDWDSLSLDDVRAVKQQLGCTVNDVVVNVVAGAVGDFFRLRGFHPSDPDFTFRIFCPVGLSHEGAQRTGNHVSAMMVDVPIFKSDPLERLRDIHAATAAAKRSRQAEGLERIESFADVFAPWLLGAIDSLAASALTFNVVCTNVPGPQLPLYLMGARMLEGYPYVPLFKNQGLGIALLSYDGRLGWGFAADRGVMPDLHEFMLAVHRSLEGLCAAAGVEPSRREEAEPDS
jgi:diacylglycerol O-acyltransferase